MQKVKKNDDIGGSATPCDGATFYYGHSEVEEIVTRWGVWIVTLFKFNPET